MDRRTFLAGTGSVLLAAPHVAHAQQAGKVYRIGWLAGAPNPPERWKFFLDAMRERGWIEGQNFTMEFRIVEFARAEAAARELVNLNVDLLLAVNTSNAWAARRATSTIPIVMVTSGYPVETGLAASLARPGGNVTGNASYAGGEMWGKYIELFRELVPGMTRLALLWGYVPPAFLQEEAAPAVEYMKQAAQSLGVTMPLWEFRTARDLDPAFAAIAGQRVDALFVTSGPVTYAERARIREFALKHRLPTMSDYFTTADAGILLTYTARIADLFRGAAYFVDRILRGARPGDLPIQLPSRFDMIINLKTAKALGLTIPPSLLARADQVIE